MGHHHEGQNANRTYRTKAIGKSGQAKGRSLCEDRREVKLLQVYKIGRWGRGFRGRKRSKSQKQLIGGIKKREMTTEKKKE